MRWIYLILAVVGTLFLMKSYAAKFAATVLFNVPGINIGVTYGILTVMLLIGLGAAKLKFGK